MGLYSASTSGDVESYNFDPIYYLLPFDVQIYFQVKHDRISRIYNPRSTNQLDMFPRSFTGQESGWINTQRVTIPGRVDSILIVIIYERKEE